MAGLIATVPNLSQPSILVLAHRLPYPPDKGDRIRTFHVLRFLAERADVHLACLADEPYPGAVVAALYRHCRRVAIVPIGSWARRLGMLSSLLRGGTATEGAFRSPALEAVVRAWARQTRFDAALASASSMVPYLRLEELRDVPAVIDLVDVDSQKWLQYAEACRAPMAWLYRLEHRRLRRLEQELPTRARAVTLVSQREADLYREFCAAGSVQAIPNGVDLAYFAPPCPAAEEDCVFVGALDYLPNVDAACWFCQEVWPQVYQRRPQTKVHLVGRRPVPAIRRLADLPGVEMVGQVQDVRPYVSRAAIAVAPLRIARGVQNKVLEAMAMGKATIASPEALAGLWAEPGVHLLAASTVREWVTAILRLLDDPALRRRIGSAGRRYVEEEHCWERCLTPFGGLLGLPAQENGHVSDGGNRAAARHLPQEAGI
jgi:sugar transferase (PEP-CTERM/EpsH1 system associated)